MTSLWYLVLPVLLGTSSARADEATAPLTLQRVVELAKSRAPDGVIARARVDERAASRVGARQLATRNPVLSADAGPRWENGETTDVQGSLSIPVDLGGRRAGRIAVADADVRRAQLEAEVALLDASARAAKSYFEVLHAERRLVLGEERVRLAQSAVTTAQQRVKSGDAPEFEVNLASGEVARAEGAAAAARADLSRARGGLAVTLGLPLSAITVAGDLADRTLVERPGSDVVRADLRTLAQEAELAGAEATLARSERWPSFDFRITYQHERDAEILLGGVAVALPVLAHGQGDEATARARAKRALAEVQVRSAVVSLQVESARATYEAAVAAVRVYEERAVPLSLQNETAAAASYRAGKLELGSLLLIRRETLDTRREHLDRLLEAALAGVDLWVSRGATL